MQNNVTDTPVSGSTRQQGIVKWFNNRSGFGFVTTLGDDTKDIFVHHSGVSVNREQYKYLVQGEYVEFVLTSSSNSEHKFQATHVTGIGGGQLMCETRFLNKQERTDKDEVEDDGRREKRPQRRNNHNNNNNNNNRRRGGGPRDNTRGNDKWVVENRAKPGSSTESA